MRILSWGTELDDLILFYDRSLAQAKEFHSDSPVKIALRTFDNKRLYSLDFWGKLEPYLQRTLFHCPHCIDYIALLVVKRIAIGKEIDRDGWKAACYELIQRHLPLNHHHEVVWLFWLLIVAKLDLTERLITSLSQNPNAHIRSLVVAAYTEQRIPRKPPIRLGSKLATADEHWLLNLVAKTNGYSGANFSGPLTAEFEHISNKRVRLIDFESHMTAMKKANSQAISLTRYGYDGVSEEDEDEFFDDPD